jgi:dienelactone hydrolase
MASLILFHSVLGLRDSERQFEARLRAAGHVVWVPDLYAGAATDDLAEGFAIQARIGWGLVCARARAARADLPAHAVLAGISMGAGVVAEMWPTRPLASKVLLLHGLAGAPPSLRPGIPLQLHVSDSDPLFPDADVRAWQAATTATGADVQVFRYPDCGHYFSDARLPDFSEAAASRLWERILAFLAECRATH